MDLIASEVVKNDSPFMNLPTEIREMIYRHLVIAKFTKREHNMRSREFDLERNDVLRSPDQTHQFFPAIFGTNRIVHEELVALCQRENDFVCFTSHWPSHFAENFGQYRLEQRQNDFVCFTSHWPSHFAHCAGKLGQYGLEFIAKGPKARGFWNISMTLTLNPLDLDGRPGFRSTHHQTTDLIDSSEDDRPGKYIFCSDELPTFCRLVLNMGTIDGRLFQDTALCIGVNPAIWKGQAIEMDSSPAGRSRTQKLLEPLRQLHSFRKSRVEGPLSGTYKESISKSVCNDCPTALEIIRTVMDALTQGNERMSESHFVRANQHYKQALSYAGSCCWQYHEKNFITEEEPFPGLTTAQVLANLQVRLHARISLMYAKSGMLRMARIYTERALDPRRVYDDRHNKTLSLDLQPWEEVVYAEVFLVAAEISGTHGQVEHAVRDLRAADRLVPLGQEQQSRYERWKEDANRIGEKYHNKWLGQCPQRLIEKKKAEEMLQVVCNRKTTGDQLLRSGRSHLAASKFQAALSKLDLLTQTDPDHFTLRTTTYQGHYSLDATNVLTFKLQANIAAACLMSRRYEEVDLWTSTALDCSHDQRSCPHRYIDAFLGEVKRDWKEEQGLDYLKIHYCKAMARKHMGDSVGALMHMEKALSFDPGDSTVYTQLSILKKT